MNCRVCGDPSVKRELVVREMMYGLRDPFRYTECAGCGSLSLADIPADLGRYYPSDYYSLSKEADSGFKKWLKRVRARHALGLRSPLGAALCRVWGKPPFVEWFGPLRLPFTAAILDVGTGNGDMLRQMASAGFVNLTGIDPYLPQDDVSPGLRILRRRLEEVEERFDCVMFNHSFEHVDDPSETLRTARARIGAGGHVVVRTPVAGCRAEREYGADWVQLDAPRHIMVPSEEGMRRLAESAGFRLAAVRYDSTGFQFWGSEQYRRDIPLMDERSYAIRPENGTWKREEILRFEAQAAKLNQESDGDQATFYLEIVR